MRIISVLVLTSLVLSAFYVTPQAIRYVESTDKVDRHGDYFVQLINLAMTKSAVKYGQFELIPVQAQIRQQRQFKSLDADLLDLVWTVTSKQREQEALPVRIPLLKGLIGFRVLVIKKSLLDPFSRISSLQDLAEYTGVQGHDWPDAEILDRAGLKIERIVWHESIYRLITSGIVDYFPRSILEVVEELERAEYDELIIDPNNLIIYPSALYFFVQKDNHKLAQRLEYGLTKAISDGSFDELFYAYPGHKKAFKEIPFRHKNVFRLPNHNIPEITPLDEPSLWMQINY